MKVLVLGGDGFCGWPCAVNLADQGHEVLIVVNLQIDVDLPTTEVVHDQNLVALIRKVHRTGPAAEAVTAENENFHPKLLLERA